MDCGLKDIYNPNNTFRQHLLLKLITIIVQIEKSSMYERMSFCKLQFIWTFRSMRFIIRVTFEESQNAHFIYLLRGKSNSNFKNGIQKPSEWVSSAVYDLWARLNELLFQFIRHIGRQLFATGHSQETSHSSHKRNFH